MTVPPNELQPAPSGVDRLIPLAVNVLGVVLVAALAFYLGNALYEGVTARAVALIGIAAVIVTLVLAPDVGLLLWFVLAPFGRLFNISMGRGLPDLSLNRIVVLCLLCLLFAQVATGKRRLARLSAVEGWGLAFVLALTVSIGTSSMGWVAGIQNVFDYMALPLLCVFFARNFLWKRNASGEPTRIRWTAVTLAIIVAALGFIAAREQLTNQPVLSPVPYRWDYGRHSVKVLSLFGAPSMMAMTLALPLPFVLVGAMRARDLAPRVLWFLALALGAAGLLLTYVRAGWLAAIVELVIVAAMSRRGRSLVLILLLIALLAALVLGAGLVDLRSLQERLASEQPIEYRLQAISVGLELAARSPLLGLGLDNFTAAAIASGWQPTGGGGRLVVAAHNLFIYVLTSGGLLALVPFLAMLAAMGLRLISGLRAVGSDPARADLRDWLIAGLAMLTGYVIIGNTFDAVGAQYANMILFLSLGATFAAVEPPPRGNSP